MFVNISGCHFNKKIIIIIIFNVTNLSDPRLLIKHFLSRCAVLCLWLQILGNNLIFLLLNYYVIKVLIWFIPQPPRNEIVTLVYVLN